MSTQVENSADLFIVSNGVLVKFSETGGLFGLAVRLMQLFSSNAVDMGPLMAILGLYFQIRDDYANLNLKEVSLQVNTRRSVKE